jgi:hypothetical protein
LGEVSGSCACAVAAASRFAFAKSVSRKPRLQDGSMFHEAKVGIMDESGESDGRKTAAPAAAAATEGAAAEEEAAASAAARRRGRGIGDCGTRDYVKGRALSRTLARRNVKAALAAATTKAQCESRLEQRQETSVTPKRPAPPLSRQ